MPRFVVLLRGVNVGKGRRVPMVGFRALLEGLGHTRVATLMNSGNAVFDSAGRSPARHARAIAQALLAQFAVDMPVVVKAASEFAAAVAAGPAPPPPAEHARYLVTFAPDADGLRGLAAIRPLVQPAERFTIGDHAAYLHCAGGILDSQAASALLGPAGRGVTTRNWATVLKLAALLRVDPGAG